MRIREKPGCATALVVALLVLGSFLAFRWWRAPSHGGLIVLSGSLTPPYVLEGSVELVASRAHPDCTSFKVQNPIPAYKSVAGHFQRLGDERYRMVMELREAPLGGFCEWRIELLVVHLYPRKHAGRGAQPFSLIPPFARTSFGDRPWWEPGPVKVHCRRSNRELECVDAVNAVHSVEGEGHYSLDIEVVNAPAPSREPIHDAGEQEGDE